MPLPEVNFVISTGTAVAVVGAVWRMAWKIATTDTKVNTLWDYHIRRAVVAGLNNDTLLVNSPIRPTPKGEEWFKDISKDLHAWYVSGNYSKVDDRSLFVAIEKDFGRRITHEVAVPHNLHPGEAVAIAVALCRSYKLP
jgi:hypothetical protein